MNNIIYAVILVLLNYFLFKNINIIAKKINLYDEPNHRKIHKEKVPLLGGLFFLLI